jgi:hypothetical protein
MALYLARDDPTESARHNLLVASGQPLIAQPQREITLV